MSVTNARRHLLESQVDFHHSLLPSKHFHPSAEINKEISQFTCFSWYIINTQNLRLLLYFLPPEKKVIHIQMFYDSHWDNVGWKLSRLNLPSIAWKREKIVCPWMLSYSWIYWKPVVLCSNVKECKQNLNYTLNISIDFSFKKFSCDQCFIRIFSLKWPSPLHNLVRKVE